MELRRVVITGLGVLTPIGNNVADFWDALLKGVSGASYITYFNTENFKTKFACELKNFNVLDYMLQKEAQRMDPVAQYALVSTMEALEDSKLDLDAVDKNRVGVVFGTGVGGFNSMQESANVYNHNNNVPRFSPYLLIKVLADLIPGYISLKYGFRGPNFVTTSACASSANAIADAMQLIQLGKADVIIAGGAEACINEIAVGGFDAMRALSTNNEDPEHASRPFDVHRDGFVMGEGAGSLILEDLDHALARGAKIYGEVCGVGMSADAHHVTAPDPEGLGAIMSMNLAMRDAGVNPEEVDYINMHGTSTQLGDLAECNAIQHVFGSHAREMVLNSTKSMIGHLLGAGAAVESAVILLSMRDSVLHPTINIRELDPRISPEWNFAMNGPVHRDVRVAISNSFGFGGHNVSLLFKKFEC